MPNEQNLRPPFSPNEAREYGRRGGIASAESRRQKKTFAETLDRLLETPVTDKAQLEIIRKTGIPINGEPTYKDFITATTLFKAIKRGSVDDLSKLIDILGESNGVLPADDPHEDALSRSLREMAEELESDV